MSSFNLTRAIDSFYILVKSAQIKMQEPWIPEEFSKKLEEVSGRSNITEENLEKAFKDYGLEDFRTDISIANSYEMLDYLQGFYTDLGLAFISARDSAEDKSKSNIYTAFFNTCNQIADQMSKIYEDAYIDQVKFITNIKLIRPIVESGIKLNAGTSIWKVYPAIKNLINGKYRLNMKFPSLENSDIVKQYFKMGEFYLVFSTKPKDLVGIAERGIESCQSFEQIDPRTRELSGKSILDNKNQRLIGTILSKYVGVVYVTTGKDINNRGEKMLYRALVKIVYNIKNGNYLLSVDKLYPSSNDAMMQRIIDELQKRSSIPVIDGAKVTVPKNLCTFKEEHIPKEFITYPDIKISEKNIDITQLDFKTLLQSNSVHDRIIAAKNAPINMARVLKSDDDKYVRYVLTQQLPISELPSMKHDSYNLIRQFIASKAKLYEVIDMLTDSDDKVKEIILDRMLSGMELTRENVLILFKRFYRLSFRTDISLLSWVGHHNYTELIEKFLTHNSAKLRLEALEYLAKDIKILSRKILRKFINAPDKKIVEFVKEQAEERGYNDILNEIKKLYPEQNPNINKKLVMETPESKAFEQAFV